MLVGLDSLIYTLVARLRSPVLLFGKAGTTL